MRKYLIGSALILGIGLGTVLFVAFQPYRAFKHSAIVDFPKGTSSAEMGRKLTAAGVVRHPTVFRIARALRPFSKLQAGEYEFADASSPSEIVERLIRGDVHYYELQVREGSTIFDVAEAVGKLGFLKGSDFLKAARDPAAVRDLAPTAPSLEGFLFPSTYRLTRSANIDQVVKMMTDQFRRQWKVALRNGKAPANVLDVVTLASLVEKESGVPAERPVVASVYKNRLDKNIKLDADPTTIYAAILQGRWRGVIHRSDLDSDHPYNTYQQLGLPPGPIANPGLASIEAALRPAESKYLYFVAKGDHSGSHNFSPDYATHQKFVAMYRARVKK